MTVVGRAAVPPAAMQRVRSVEDEVVGDEIVRHTLRSRVVHWVVTLVGGLSVARWLHAWLGIAFAAASLIMFVQWASDMRFDATDKSFRVLEYLKFSAAEDPEVGKYNAGQKFFFWAALLGALALLLSGIVLWFP